MIGLGSASQLGIGIAVVLQDKFTQTANNVNNSLKNMQKNANSYAVAAMRDYRNQQAAIAAGAAVVSSSMYNLAKDGAAIQHTINQVAIIGGGKLGKTREQLMEMGTAIGIDYARKPGEMAEAMLENVRAGVTSNLALITEYQTAAASITGEQLGGEEGVAKKLLGIQHAYGIASKDFARVANATAATANLTMASISSIGESMEYAAFTAHQFNIPLEDTFALIGKLSQMGIEGSSSGVAIQNMVSRLGQSVGVFRTKKQDAAWAKLGINPDEVKPLLDTGKIFEVVSMIEEASKKLGPSDKGSILPALLNVRGTRGALASFGDPNNPQTSLKSLRTGILGGEASDIARTQGKAATDDLASDMVRMAANWDAFKVAFSNAAAPMLRTFIHIAGVFTRTLTAIANSPFGPVIVGLASVLVPLVGILAAFRAAAIGVTLALIQYRKMSTAGGFNSLMMAGLGMAGIPGTNNATAQGLYAGALRQNRAGRWQVAGGKTFTHVDPTSGLQRTFKGGQFIPKGMAPTQAMMTGMALGQSASAGNGLFGKIGGFIGKAGPLLGKIAGFAVGAISIVGTVIMIGSIVKSIYDWLMQDSASKHKDIQDENMERYYLRQLTRVQTGEKAVVPNMMGGGSPFRQSSVDQQIQIYIDGKQSMTKRVLNNSWADVDENFMLSHSMH